MISERVVFWAMISLLLGVLGLVANNFDPHLKGKVPTPIIVILFSIGFLVAFLKWLRVRSMRKF